jgi:DNA polymerase III epsilon subunit-like protein
MRLLGLDLETTGLDNATDRITEIGLVLWDSDKNAPIKIWQDFLIDDGIRKKLKNPEIVDMIQRVCGLTPEILEEFGKSPELVLGAIETIAKDFQIDYVVAHNGENFDKPFLLAELSRHAVVCDTFRSLPWIDTRADIPFPTEPDSRKLKHLALDCGFINPFAHRAVFDVLTMLRVLSHYQLEEVIAYSKVPFVTVRAVVSYDDREKAKSQRYSWEKLGERSYPKMWVKRIKENQLEKEKAACNFQVVRIE